MKNFGIHILLCGLCLAVFGSAALADSGPTVAEAVYISTDKDCYVAGDLIFCSAFCVNPLDGCRLSSASSVAYIELVSSEGTAATAKIALIDGRGSGVIPLPLTISTGNYSLCAYTSLGRGEFEPYVSRKTVSVFNTLNTERVPDGVTVTSRSEYEERADVEPTLRQEGQVRLFSRRSASPSSTIQLSIENSFPEATTMSVSVHCLDGIIPPENDGLASFIADTPTSVRASSTVPDFEGETVRGRLMGADADEVRKSHQYIPIISSPGANEDLYAGTVIDDGSVEFHTGNIYGKKDIFCEILRLEDGMDCRFILESPFIGPEAGDLPQLEISSAIGADLTRRSLAMQTARSANLDTLYEYLPKRESLLFSDLHPTRYRLDEYTRFPTIKDIFVEFVPTVRIRKGRNGKRMVQVLLEDLPGNLDRFSDDVLVMLDGVPVSDHERLLPFDAMLLSDIFIYPYTYIVGSHAFKGVVNLVTPTHNISSLKFDDNLVILDFQGASYPVAFTGSKGVGDVAEETSTDESGVSNSGSEATEDLRGTLYWHPQVELPAGKTLMTEIHTPSYTGNFKVVVEGLTESGTPFVCETLFEVR